MQAKKKKNWIPAAFPHTQEVSVVAEITKSFLWLNLKDHIPPLFPL